MEFFKQLQIETGPDRKHLLDAPIIHQVFRGEFCIDDYVSFLVQAYHHVKHTVPLLMATGSRLSEEKEWLRQAIGEYIEEEMGHQEWILNDIANCGFDKETVRNSRPAPSTELMVSYAYDSIQRKNPVSFFGMVHVLEGTSVELAELVADSVKDKLNLPKNAFSYLYSHGSLDQDHIKFFEDLMNKIETDTDRAAIMHSSKMFYRLYGDVFRSLTSNHGIPRTLRTA